RVEANAGADEHRIGLDVEDREHGSKQSVLVLAVAVLVGEDLGCGVGLIPPDAEVDPDVMDLTGDVVIDGLSFFEVVGFAGRELSDLGFDGGVRSDAVRSKAAIPLAHSGIVGEGGPCEARERAFGVVHLFLRRAGTDLFSLLCGLGCSAYGRLEIGAMPAIDMFPIRVGFGGRDAGARVGPDREMEAGRYVQFVGFVQDDYVAQEGVLTPELVWDFGVISDETHLPLHRVANPETADGKLLALEVAVFGRLLGDGDRLLERGRKRRLLHGTVGMHDTRVNEFGM